MTEMPGGGEGMGAPSSFDLVNGGAHHQQYPRIVDNVRLGRS